MNTLTLIRQENIPRNTTDSCFTVHKISLMDNEEEAGYIKLCYISSEHTDFHLFKFLGLKGHGVFNINSLSDIDNINEKDKVHSVVYHIAMTAKIGWNEANRLADAARTTDKPSRLLINHGIPERLKELYEAEHKQYIDYFVDCPFVEYIRIKEGYNGKNHSIRLYTEAAIWMLEMGLPLRLSNLLCSEAVKRIRQKMIEQELVEPRTTIWYGKKETHYFMKQGDVLEHQRKVS